MYKARIRRPRRSRRPLPCPEAPTAEASPVERQACEVVDPLRRYLGAGGDYRGLKVSAFFALAAHFLLFFVVIPRAEVVPARLDERVTAMVLQR